MEHAHCGDLRSTSYRQARQVLSCIEEQTSFAILPFCLSAICSKSGQNPLWPSGNCPCIDGLPVSTADLAFRARGRVPGPLPAPLDDPESNPLCSVLPVGPPGRRARITLVPLLPLPPHFFVGLLAVACLNCVGPNPS